MLASKVREWQELLWNEQVVTLDTETTVSNHDIGTSKANPFHPDNTVVMFGCKFLADDYTTTRTLPGHVDYDRIHVGHNIKFDMHHMRKWCGHRRFPHFIWDTQLAQYLLSGQKMKWNSLEQCCALYDIPVKETLIEHNGEMITMKQYWDDDGQTEDIDPELLSEYLRQDVEATEKVFLEQIKLVLEADALPFYITQMFALVATTEMEWNGLHFDTATALKVKAIKEVECSELQTKLNDRLGTVLDDPNVLSNQQLGAYLFGATLSRKERLPVLTADGEKQYFKTGAKKGQLKTKLFDVSVDVDGVLSADTAEKNKSGWKVDSATLTKLSLTCDDDVAQFITDVLSLRQMTKDLGTYYEGYTKLVWPHDGLIHHSLNHTATATGRLSSSEPNGQNLSGKEV